MGGAVSVETVLHVGCGGNPLPEWISGQETRLDIDGRHSPDILASMTDMGEIGRYDLVYCSHALEHLYPHEVKAALSEFRRVLKDGGRVIVIVPDLEGVEPTHEPLFDTPAGPISGFDLFYGLPRLVETSPYMAHHCGFVRETLAGALQGAGFGPVNVLRANDYNLIGAARK